MHTSLEVEDCLVKANPKHLTPSPPPPPPAGGPPKEGEEREAEDEDSGAAVDRMQPLGLLRALLCASDWGNASRLMAAMEVHIGCATTHYLYH